MSKGQDSPVSVALSTDAETLDPRLAFNVPAQSIIRHIYEPLVTHNMRGYLAPVLAVSWIWSEDARALDMKLREGVTFHDGTPLTARDVKYTFDTILAPESGSRQKPTLFYVAETETIDDLTIRIHTHIPARPLLPTLSLYPLGIMNADWARYRNGKIGVEANGTGPFRVIDYIPGRQVVLEANPTYWGQRPRTNRLIIRIVEDDDARVQALLSGEVMMINNVPPRHIPKITQDIGLRLWESVTARTIYGQINLTNPSFGDRRVRHALNYAVDKERIVQRVLGGHGQAASCPVAPSVFGHYLDMKPWPYDPEQARSLLAQVGYTASAPLTVRLIGPSGRFVLDEQVGEALAACLANVGIRTTYRSVERDAYADARFRLTDWDVILSGWCVHTLEADFLLSRNFYHEWVPVGYSNPEVKAILDRVRAITDIPQTESLYHKAQQLIWNDAPWIWLYYQADVHAASERLGGFNARPDEFLLFHGASLTT
jgi:ABC-type transport system substrate-binding protein